MSTPARVYEALTVTHNTRLRWKEMLRAMAGSFTKHDQGKVRLSLIPPEFLEGVALAMMEGERNYGRGNWERCNRCPS